MWLRKVMLGYAVYDMCVFIPCVVWLNVVRRSDVRIYIIDGAIIMCSLSERPMKCV